MGHLRIRTDKGGRTRYQMLVEVWAGGRKHFKSKTFNSKQDALRWEKKIRYEIESGITTQEGLKNRKVSDAIDRYVQEQLGDKRNAENMRQHLTWWKKEIGGQPLSHLLPATIKEGVDKLLKEPSRHGKKRAPATAVKYLSSLSSVFEAAIRDWHWIEKNPARLVRKPTIQNARSRFLTEEECRKLLVSCKESQNPFLYLIALLAVSCGMRRGEILNLQWKDIDFERKVVVLHKTKNGRIRCIPMVGNVFQALKQYREDEGGITDPTYHLFPNINLGKQMDFRTAWRFAIKKAGLTDLRFHDLRHSCGSFLHMSGCAQRDIAEILGHTDIRMTQRYTHVARPHLADALERAEQKFITIPSDDGRQ